MAITLLPLGLRAAGVVMISIPLSLAIGVSTLHLLGYSLNQISIAGFVVALGLLVDDSIVVVENIARFLREGHSRMEAAILATRFHLLHLDEIAAEFAKLRVIVDKTGGPAEFEAFAFLQAELDRARERQ